MSQSSKELKNYLGLNKFPYILMSRLLVTNYKLYMVFIDSRWPKTPLTAQRVFKSPMPSMLYRYPFNNQIKHTPPFSIDEFSGDYKDSLFFVVDLSGYLGNSNMREAVGQNFNKTFSLNLTSNFKLEEGVTIKDLLANASELNKKYYGLRKAEGSTGSYLDDIQWDSDRDEITLFYSVVPTYLKDVQNYDPEGNPYKSAKYIAEIVIENVSKYIGDKKTYKEFSSSEQQKLVKDLIQNAEIRVWASDPSFLFQGAFEGLSQIGASAYDYTGPRGTGYWDSKHGGDGLHLTKHLMEILKTIPFLSNKIALKLRES